MMNIYRGKREVIKKYDGRTGGVGVTQNAKTLGNPCKHWRKWPNEACSERVKLSDRTEPTRRQRVTTSDSFKNLQFWSVRIFHFPLDRTKGA
jgi:hypothetical protein